MKQSEIEKLVKKLNIRPCAEMYEKTLADTLEAQQIHKKKSVEHRLNLWRIIMESKVTRYSVAAVTTLAAALILIGPFGISDNGGIVLAEVAEKVRQMRTVTHKEKRIVWEIGQEEPSLVADVMKYASEEYGLVEHQIDDKGTPTHQAYFLKHTKQFILVIPPEKKYIKLSMPEDIFDRMTRMLTPRGLVEYCTSGQYTKLGRANFDNFNVEGFETTDPNLFPIPKALRLLCPANGLVARLWIDVKTSLPIGIEMKFNMDGGLLTGPKKHRCEFRAYDFQWNAELPEGIFDPNIPDDYTEFKVTDLIPPEAKAGLVGLVTIPAGFVFWKKRRKKAKVNRHE
jgi:hypothetical protein